MKQLAELISQAVDAQIWQDDGAVKLYLYCLSRASHNVFKWRGLSLQPGDMPLSGRHAAEALIWSRNKLDRKLQTLVAAGLIAVRNVSRMGTLVHIVHWPDAANAGSEWLHGEATNEATTAGGGSMVEPQTEPGTKATWPHDGATTQKGGSTMEPDWPHGEASKRAGDHHRLHDCRHTFAVNSIRAGDDIKTIQENMGHYSAAFTLDRYGHVTETMRQESANRMQAFIQGMSGNGGGNS